MICAVLVSFMGGEAIKKNIFSLLKYVDFLLVVDNGSDIDTINSLKELEYLENIDVLYLTTNKGLGYALNIGIDYARIKKADWLLTMDQDSLIDDFFIASYKNFLGENKSSYILAPTIINHNIKSNIHKNSILDFAITSGNLVHMSVFDKIGSFDISFFVDAIDIDFSLRARLNGFKILYVKEALLYHSLGSRYIESGFLNNFYTFHSPLRRYYIYRNNLTIILRYWKYFPFFIIKTITIQSLYLIAILVNEKSTFINLKHIFLGLIHGATGRSGKF
jgi:rhamnosyltransferase